MQRRTLLAALSVSAASAGCLAIEPPQGPAPDTPDDPDEPDPGDDSDPANGDDPVQLPDGISSTSIDTTGTDCGGPADDRIHVLAEDERLTVDGTLPAPTPCYAATIESMSIDAGELSITIDVESTLDEGEMCPQCHGKVEYSADITLEAGVDVDTVAITHASGAVHREPLDDGATGPTDGPASIETIETGCTDQSGDESVTVRDHEHGYRIEGIRPAPNPCHAATLQTYDREGETITVEIGVESTASDDGPCIECVGAIRYEVAIRLDNPDEVTEFVVEHDGAGTHGYSATTDEEGASA